MGVTKSSKLTQEKNSVIKSALFYIVPLTVLSIYLLICYFTKGKTRMGEYYMLHFLYTYDYGFVSRGLAGEIISWFTDSVSEELMQNLLIVYFAFLCFTASLCMGKALNKASEDKRVFRIVVVLLIIVSVLPMSFRLYYADKRQDKLLWALGLLATYFACNRKTVWLTIPICIVATLVNPVFLFTSMILMSMVLLQEFKSSNYSKMNGFVCLIAYVSMIILGVWAVVSEKMLGFETARELVDTYFARFSGTKTLNYEAFELWVSDFIRPISDFVELCIYGYGLRWRGIFETILTTIFMFGPLFTMFGLFWKKAMSKTDDKMQKFIFLLCILIPIAGLPQTILSWESAKAFGNLILVELGLLVYYVANKNESVMKAVDDVAYFAKNNIIITAMAIVYGIVLMV